MRKECLNHVTHGKYWKQEEERKAEHNRCKCLAEQLVSDIA